MTSVLLILGMGIGAGVAVFFGIAIYALKRALQEERARRKQQLILLHRVRSIERNTFDTAASVRNIEKHLRGRA